MKLTDVLNARQRSAADVLQGQIARDASGAFRNDDGSYNVRLIRTQAIVRATKANPAEEYVVDTWVDLANLGASGLQQGGGYSILRRSAGEKRGVSGVPVQTTRGRSGVAVISIDPNPVQLVQGGAAESQYIHGFGLSDAPTYDSAEIVDNAAPIITSTAITSSIRATADTPLGLHDVTIHGKTFKEAVEVKARTLTLTPPSLYASAVVADGSFGGSGKRGQLMRFDPDTLALLETFDGPSFNSADPFDVGGGAIAVLGTKVLAFFWCSSTAEKVAIVYDRATQTASVLSGLALLFGQEQQFVEIGGALYGVDLSTGVGRLVIFGDDGVIDSVLHTYSDSPTGLVFDGTNFYAGTYGAVLHRTSADGLTDTAFSTYGGRRSVLVGSTTLWTTDDTTIVGGLSPVRKVRKSDMLIQASIYVPRPYLNDLLYLDGAIYVAIGAVNGLGAAGNRSIYKIDETSGTISGSIDVGAATGCSFNASNALATDGSRLFASGLDRTISRIDPSTFAIVATSAAFSPRANDMLVRIAFT